MKERLTLCCSGLDSNLCMKMTRGRLLVDDAQKLIWSQHEIQRHDWISRCVLCAGLGLSRISTINVVCCLLAVCQPTARTAQLFSFWQQKYFSGKDIWKTIRKILTYQKIVVMDGRLLLQSNEILIYVQNIRQKPQTWKLVMNGSLPRHCEQYSRFPQWAWYAQAVIGVWV